MSERARPAATRLLVIGAAVVTTAIGLVGCSPARHEAGQGRTGARLSPVEQVLRRVGSGGSVSLPVAEQLFSLSVARLPGVRVPAGRSAPVLSASSATDWLYQYRDRLSAPQRQVLDAAMAPALARGSTPVTVHPASPVPAAHAAAASQSCADLPVAPGQPPTGSNPIGPPVAPVPAWVGGLVTRVRAFYADALDRPLPGPVCLDSTSGSDNVANTVAIPSGSNPDGSNNYEGGYLGCEIFLGPRWFEFGRRDESWVLAHEVFHCFERSYDNKPYQYFDPGWVKEGQASWAADQYAKAAGLGASDLDAHHWAEYLDGATPLFQQSYGAVGFYTALEHDGVPDEWATLDRMRAILVADLPCPQQQCYPSIDFDDIADASNAAFHTAIGESTDVSDTLLSLTALDHSLGEQWDLDDPLVPSSVRPHPVTEKTLGAGDTVSINSGGDETEIDDVALSAPVVEVVAAGWIGVVRLPDGSTRSIQDLGDDALFCTSDDCPTDCPDFGDVPVIAGDSLQLAATTLTQLTSGTDPTASAPVLVGYPGCPPPTKPTPSPGEGGGSGGGGTGGGSGTGGGAPIEPCEQNLAGCAVSWGDPHQVGYDGRSFDFQGAGEFDASLDPAGGFEIQVRQEPQSASRSIALITAIALAVASHRVEVRASGRRPTVLVDGHDWAGTRRTVGSGGRIAFGAGSDDRTLGVTWPDGSRAWISPFVARGLSLTVDPSAARGPRLVGLLGNRDGDPSDDVALRNGTVLPAGRSASGPPTRSQLYPEFADSWRIAQSSSLFTYKVGQSTATFIDRNFPYADPPSVPTDGAPAAQCRQAGVTRQPYLDDCILDVTSTGSGSAATASSAAEHDSKPPVRTSAVAIKTVDVTPTGSTTAYPMTLWATDEITDCAAHAYGTIADWLRRNPCRHETRYLWTTPLGSRTLAVSVVSLVAASPPAAADLAAQENGSGTGSVDDLLRDGTHVPDFFGRHIPATEVFSTATEDDGVAVFDAWYLDHNGPAVDPHDPGIRSFEQGLFLTAASAVHL